MLYINEVSKDKSGTIKEVRVIYSLERNDIEFQFPTDIIIKAINRGQEYATAIVHEQEYFEGADVIVVDGHLRTVANAREEDNLDNLPEFK